MARFHPAQTTRLRFQLNYRLNTGELWSRKIVLVLPRKSKGTFFCWFSGHSFAGLGIFVVTWSLIVPVY